MAGRAKFSHDEMKAYFRRVHLPESQQIFDVASLSTSQQLDYLRLLCKHHLVSVPWENLSQHYSYTRTIQTHAAALHNKIVANSSNSRSSSSSSNSNNRGGYCMETNHLLHVVLHTLGFHAWLGGARIYSSHARSFGGWTHVVNLVRLVGSSSSEQYMLDGGLGGGGPPQPVLMRGDGGVAVPMEIGTEGAEIRLVRRGLNAHVDAGQRVWLYQYRYRRPEEAATAATSTGGVTPDVEPVAAGASTPVPPDREGIEEDEKAGWRTPYCFTELEFLPTDLVDMNFSPWLNPRTFFTHKVVATRFTTATERTEYPGAPDEGVLTTPIDGSINLIHDTLKWRRKGRTVVDVTLKDEAERVAALKHYFGIVLTQEDRNAIVGSAAELAMKAIGE